MIFTKILLYTRILADFSSVKYSELIFKFGGQHVDFDALLHGASIVTQYENVKEFPLEVHGSRARFDNETRL